MPDGAPWTVFLSHTAELRSRPSVAESYVGAAERCADAAGHRARSLTIDPTAEPLPSIDAVRQAVGEADVHVLIAGFRYGVRVPGDPADRSYPEFEFDEAGALGLPRLVFLLEENEFVDSDPGSPQQRFRDRARTSGGVYRTFADPAGLEAGLAQALTELSAETWTPGQSAPTLPPHGPTMPAPEPATAPEPPTPPRPPHRAGPARRRPRRPWDRRVLAALAAAVAVVVLATVAFVTCGGPVNPCDPVPGEQVRGGDGTLRLGSVLPQTGPLSVQGEQLRAATEMAVRDIRRAGDMPGVPGGVTLPPRDQLDEGDPTTQLSCEAAGRLIADGVDAISGPDASASAVRMIPRFTAAGGVLFGAGTSAPELSNVEDNGRFFRTTPSDVLEGRILGDLVAGDGGQNIVVVERGDTYGRGLGDVTAKELRGLYVRDVRSVEYDPVSNPEDTDFGPVVDNIRGQPTDAIVAIGFDEVGWLLRDLASKGITPREMHIYATDGFLRDTFPSNPVIGGPELVAGTQGSRPLVDRTFSARLSAAAGRSFQDYSLSAQTYDTVIITALAALAARSDDPRVFGPEINDVTRAGRKCTSYAACRALLATDPDTDIDYDGASGPLDFNGDGEPCVGYYSIERYDAGGRLQEYRRAYGNNLCTGLLPEPK